MKWAGAPRSFGPTVIYNIINDFNHLNDLNCNEKSPIFYTKKNPSSNVQILLYFTGTKYSLIIFSFACDFLGGLFDIFTYVQFFKGSLFYLFSFFRVQFFFLTYLSNKINYKKHFTLSGPNNMANYLGLAVLTLSLYVLLSIKTLALSWLHL